MPDIKIDNLQAAVLSELQNYSNQVDDIMQDEIDKVSKETVNNLKNNSNIPVRTGKYKRSFFVKKIAQGKGFKRVAVANRVYQLTHLLERGYLINGIRTRSFPHWSEAQQISDTLPDRIERRLSDDIR